MKSLAMLLGAITGASAHVTYSANDAIVTEAIDEDLEVMSNKPQLLKPGKCQMLAGTQIFDVVKFDSAVRKNKMPANIEDE